MKKHLEAVMDNGMKYEVTIVSAFTAFMLFVHE
jgi:hypothetical protein